MNEILTNLSKVIPQLFILAAVFGFIGWSLRGLGGKPAAKPAGPAPSASKSPGADRVKNLEAALEKSRSSHKALKTEFDQLKADTVPRSEFDTVFFERDEATKSLEVEARRAATLEADLKKAQDTNKALNSRTNEAEKANKDRGFTLENELSKAREQLAIFQNRPDDSAQLQSEIERLRESVATSTRFAGELRKREAAAVEALEKAEARLASALENGGNIPVPARKIGPVGDSSRIAAAKAEVIRLVEENKKKAQAIELAVEATPAPAEPEPAAPEPSPVATEADATTEEPETVAAPGEKAPEPAKRTPAPGDLFALD